MSEDVIDYLAGKYSNDVRNLEGTLNRLIFNATLFNPDVIDMDFARKVLIKEPIVSQSDELTIKKIKKAVTRFYGLSYKDLEENVVKNLSQMHVIFVFIYPETCFINLMYLSVKN